VTSLGVVPDVGIGLESEPSRNRSVLFLLLGQNELIPEGFMSRHVC